MKYGRICAASRMNASIYRCLGLVPESVARVFVKNFAEQPHDEPQVMHTFRELVIGAYLGKCGFAVQPEPLIDGKTPDWLIGPNVLLETVSLHAPNDVEEDIRKQCEATIAAGALVATAGYWPQSNTNRLYDRIDIKARAYQALAKERPYVVSVFANIEIDVTDDEIHECVSGDAGLFVARPLLSGVVRIIERGGVYDFRYFANPHATNPFAFPAGSLDLHVDPRTLAPEWQ